jgi:hypothetical protein
VGFQWRYKTHPLFKNGPIKIKPVTYPLQHKTEPVFQFDGDGNFLKEFSSIELAAKTIGTHPETIRRCFRGESKTGMGFQWRNRSDPIFKNSL